MAKSTSSLASSISSTSSSSSCSSSSASTSSSSFSSSRSRGSSDDKSLSLKSSSSIDRRKRLAANARERKRMHLLNKAYDELRMRLADAENKSKYDVLVQAKEYIQALATICEKFDRENPGIQLNQQRQPLHLNSASSLTDCKIQTAPVDMTTYSPTENLHTHTLHQNQLNLSSVSLKSQYYSTITTIQQHQIAAQHTFHLNSQTETPN